MKKGLKYIIFILGVFLIILGEKNSSAQKVDAFARVSVTPREGVVRQPYNVTITVYSSTWFAKPLQFSNLHIENAFIVPFTRTVSGINYINNKKYATLTFYYLVFPYESGKLIIPELEINASISPEGDYKGVPTTILTKQQNIRVNQLPSTKEQEVWMVAKNVTVRETWSKDLQQLKVGDVLEREIIITGEGTLPSLILPLEIEKPQNVSVYPAEPELQDKRNDKDANGMRIEKYSYLFEKEGELVIPEQVIRWWNPDTKKVYQRTLPEQQLNIATNPDMTMMESLKDSLLAMSAPVETEVDENIFSWLRLGLFVLLAVLLFFLLKLGWKGVQRIRIKKEVYRQSEAYYFKKVLDAINHDSTSDFISELYVWFDKARKPEQEAAIRYFLNSEENSLLETIIKNKETKLNATQKSELAKLIRDLRNSVLNTELLQEVSNRLNPV